MKQLFEYLISKENKSKVSSKYTKSMLTSGDILQDKSDDYLYYLSDDDFYSLLENTRNESIYIYNAWKKIELGEGIFLLGSNSYMNPKKYSEDLFFIDTRSVKNGSIKQVYPGEQIKSIKTIQDITQNLIKEEAKKRKAIKAI